MDHPRFSGNRSLPTQTQTSHLLQNLFPPQAVILVGASRSQRYLFDWPGVNPQNILLVDAQPETLASIRQNFPESAAWQMRSTVLADRAGEACFFSASNPGEDGLVSPEKLAELWPNLRTSAERICITQPLKDLLAEPELAGLAETDATWLVIDCLPALRILQGAGALLQRCKVISLRVLLAPLEDGEPGTTLAEIEQYLAAHRFRCIHCTEGNHPQIGQALFLRDDSVQHEQQIACLLQAQADLASERNDLEQQNAALLATCQALKTENTALQAERNALHHDKTRLATERVSLTQAQATLARERDTLRQQNNELSATRNALSLEKADLLAECEALRQGYAALTVERDALAQEKAGLTSVRDKLTAERDQQAKLAVERQAQLDTLGKEKTALVVARDEQAKLANERKAQLDTLTKEKTDLTISRDKLTAERDQQVKLAAERQAQLDTLAKEKAALVVARDEQTKLANDRKIQLDTLAKEKADLLASRDALTKEKTDLTASRDKLTAERDQQAKLAAERDGRIRQLETEHQESLIRLRLMQDELVKGEAQIELIKDLLLREPNRSADHVA